MKSIRTQIKEHASKTFGFSYSKIVPLECNTTDGVVYDYTFSVCGREYAAHAGADFLYAKCKEFGGEGLIQMAVADEEYMTYSRGI